MSGGCSLFTAHSIAPFLGIILENLHLFCSGGDQLMAENAIWILFLNRKMIEAITTCKLTSFIFECENANYTFVVESKVTIHLQVCHFPHPTNSQWPKCLIPGPTNPSPRFSSSTLSSRVGWMRPPRSRSSRAAPPSSRTRTPWSSSRPPSQVRRRTPLSSTRRKSC